MHRGYVKLWRKLLDWQWKSSPNHLSLFITLILHANYKTTKWRKEIIAPGQLLTGLTQLSFWSGIAKSTVNRILNDFENSGEVERKKTRKYSIITITNWPEYQQSETQMELKWNSSGTQVETSKNYKKEKKEKNICLFDFEKIWNLYPKPIGKKNALRHFNASVKTQLDYDNIFTALENYKKSDTVKKGFIQNANTWFNSWQDWVNYKNENKQDKLVRPKITGGEDYEKRDGFIY